MSKSQKQFSDLMAIPISPIGPKGTQNENGKTSQKSENENLTK